MTGARYDRLEKLRKWALIVGGIAVILALGSFYTRIVEVEGQISEKEGL
jgi:hypothetical protein